MAQILNHNMAAQVSLGELNKNISKLGQAIAKVAGGQKITGAKDDSASFAISEIMRVKIRALEQATQNVQNGNALLRTAEEGIQQQIDILRTIREKVIDACNDTNTDQDRLIIQKEINQFYDQMDQTAYYTDYNTKKVLLGDTYWTTSSRWIKADDVVLNPDSVADVIPDVYDILDGIEGPFDIFSTYGTSQTTIEPILGTNTQVNLSGGTDGTASVITYDFSQVYNGPNVPNDFEGLGFTVSGYSYDGYYSTKKYLLTADTSILYNNADTSDYYTEKYTKIDISSCTSFNDLAQTIADKINSYQSNYTEATADNGVLKLTSKNLSATSNNCSISQSSVSAITVVPTGRQGATQTNIQVPQYLTGGTNPKTETKIITPEHKVYNPKTDREETVPAKTETFVLDPGSKAKLENIDISGVDEGSGFIITGKGYPNTANIKFDDSVEGYKVDTDGVYLINKNFSGSITLLGMTLSISNGKMSLEANSVGTYPNDSYGITSDGFAEVVAGTPITYNAVTSLNATKGTHWTMEEGEDGNTAIYDIDLTDYDTTNTDTLKTFINELKGKNIYAVNSGYEFIDTTQNSSMDAMSKSSYSVVDLKDLRIAVENGSTIADAFISIMKNRNPSRFSLETGDNNDKKILRVSATKPGVVGNNQTINLSKSEMAHYDIDFKTFFEQTAFEPSVTDYLDGKGLRVYCATHQSQWYNIQFYTDESEEIIKPASTSSADFTAIPINVSNVNDAESLVQAIYDQGAPQFLEIDHTLFLAADPSEGILTVYDNRPFNPLVWPYNQNYPYAQEKGAKIADGIVDDVIKIKKDLLIRDLIIQDTDKASMNLRLKIPDTKVDTIFDIMPDYGKKSVRDYSLTVKEDRDALIGNGTTTQGILDTGLEYLLNAAVMVGAQRARLEFDGNNLISQTENTISSESTIRDADMAKEMANYTKYNVLSQSAQAMLAQANQNMSGVLNLLQ